jgi:hypothetical protein
MEVSSRNLQRVRGIYHQAGLFDLSAFAERRAFSGTTTSVEWVHERQRRGRDHQWQHS